MKESPAEIAKFAAEMVKLAKQPEMRPHLTATEARRQEREAKRDAEAEQKRKEEWQLEAQRRDEVAAKWIDDQMRSIVPELWAKYQESKDPEVLAKAGWQLDVLMDVEERPGFEPVPVTYCQISRFHRIEWEEPKPIKSKLVKP